MKFNQDLATIHGYLCGDGYISSRDREICIKFSNTNLTLVKDFKKRIERLYEIRRKIVTKKVKNKKDLYYYNATKNEVYEDLMKYCPYYTENWKIPTKFLNKTGLSLWLRAFFDSEGWIQFKPHQTRTIGAHSLNHDGLIQIQEQLKNVFRISSTVTKEKNRNISYLGIYGKDDLLKFRKEINFLHNEKRKKLKLIVNSYIIYEWDFPKNQEKLREFIKKISKKKTKLKLHKGKHLYIRMFSIIKDNLERLSKYLYDFYGIKSKVYRSVNGKGTIYYELSLQNVDSVKKMLENGLINNSIKKTLTLQHPYRN